MGMTYAKEPPTTAGNRVPKSAWRRVLMPDTKRRVCITRALSPWLCKQELVREEKVLKQKQGKVR